MEIAVAELQKAVVEALVAQAKRQIRARMRGLRAALPASAVAARSAAVVERLAALPVLRAARSVALFWPIVSKNELDLTALDSALRAQDKHIFYPAMLPTDGGYHTGFRRTDDVRSLSDRGRGFAEPPHDAPEAGRGDLDVVVVPALALSAEGHRVGYGLGFYDVTLPDVCPPATAVAVGFSFQLLGELPHDDGDFACDWVVTDDRVFDPRAERTSA
jgi:5-formyltetrahydrofolate cyclo-ligase